MFYPNIESNDMVIGMNFNSEFAQRVVNTDQAAWREEITEQAYSTITNSITTSVNTEDSTFYPNTRANDAIIGMQFGNALSQSAINTDIAI